MLFSEVSGPLSNGSARPLYGGAIGYSYGLNDSAGVSQLQQALIAYAQNMKDNSANPGTPDGQMSDYTALATIYVVWKAAGKVPGLASLKDGFNQVPGLSDLVNIILGNPTLMLGAWGIAKAGSPNTIAQIMSFIDAHATALASGINIAAGLSLGPPPPLPPAGGVPYSLPYMTMANNIKRAPLIAAGAIQTFDAKVKKYRVAFPKPLAGWGLGAITFAEQAALASLTPVASATVVSNSEFAAKTGATDLLPWYKTTMGMIGIGVGVVALGTGTYFLIK
jgi:hypothetical protein